MHFDVEAIGSWSHEDALNLFASAVRRHFGESPRAHVSHARHRLDSGDDCLCEGYLADMRPTAIHRPSECFYWTRRSAGWVSSSGKYRSTTSMLTSLTR